MVQKNHTKQIVAGVGLATLAAAAAGTYFLYGTEAGKKKRKEIKSWTLRMKADVIDSMGKMKNWSESSYHEALNVAAKKYKDMKHVDSAEVAALVTSLKNHWKSIKQEVEKASGSNKPSKQTTKRTTKRKTTKKTA